MGSNNRFRAEQVSRARTREETGKMKKETIVLDNLNCPSCAAQLEQAFKNLAGVKSASVTFATGTLDLEYDEGRLTADQIHKTAESFGVTIASRL